MFKKILLWAVGLFIASAAVVGIIDAKSDWYELRTMNVDEVVAVLDKKTPESLKDFESEMNRTVDWYENGSSIVIKRWDTQYSDVIDGKTLDEIKTILTKIVSDSLALAKSKGYNSYEAYVKGEAEKKEEAERLAQVEAQRIAKAEQQAKERAEAKKIADERAARTKTVSRNELNRVLTRPANYIGKIIKFKDSVKWDYVTEFQLLTSGDKIRKFNQIYKIEMKGANWSSLEQPLLFMPKDIFEGIDNDFYNITSKNFTDYKMQSNEMELITMSGKDFNSKFGAKAADKYVYDTDTVVLIASINIYNRKLGTYQTKMFNY